MNKSGSRSTVAARGAGNVRAVLVPVALFALAVLLWADLWDFTSPVPAATGVPGWMVDTTPVRRPALKPEIELGRFTYRCSDCHNLFPSPPETTRSLTQHTDIVLKHGINARCFNCHNIGDRDAFVDDLGGEIPYDQPQLLCAKCHGPVYRDWQHGVHGRTNGYWDTREGLQRRLKCVECHDPHQPPFPPMTPASPPKTLRMGPQAPADHLPGENPLRISQPSQSKDSAQDVAADGSSADGLRDPGRHTGDDRSGEHR